MTSDIIHVRVEDVMHAKKYNVAQNLIMPYVKYPVILIAESFTVRRVMTCIKRKRLATALFNAL